MSSSRGSTKERFAFKLPQKVRTIHFCMLVGLKSPMAYLFLSQNYFQLLEAILRPIPCGPCPWPSHFRSLCLRGGKAQFLLSADLIRSGPPRYLSFDELEVNSLITHSRSNIPSCSQVLPTQEESITQNMYTRGKNLGGALRILSTTKTLWEGSMELRKCSER